MEPTPRPPLSVADIVKLADELAAGRPVMVHRPRPVRPLAARPPALADELLHPGAGRFAHVADAAAHELATKEQQWLTQHLVLSLASAGYPVASEADLPALAGRLSMRCYPDETVVVAIDAQPKTEHHPGTRGHVLFGFAAGKMQHTPGGAWVWARLVLDARQALAYEFGQRSGPIWPAAGYSFGSMDIR
jgi:hypothetical protein